MAALVLELHEPHHRGELLRERLLVRQAGVPDGNEDERRYSEQREQRQAT
jgi:uncharacterized damage-inducible protein DinB